MLNRTILSSCMSYHMALRYSLVKHFLHQLITDILFTRLLYSSYFSCVNFNEAKRLKNLSYTAAMSCTTGFNSYQHHYSTRKHDCLVFARKSYEMSYNNTMKMSMGFWVLLIFISQTLASYCLLYIFYLICGIGLPSINTNYLYLLQA